MTTLTKRMNELEDLADAVLYHISEVETSETDLPRLLSVFDDLKTITDTLYAARKQLEGILAEAMTGPVAVGSTVYATKSKPRVVWAKGVLGKHRLLTASARRDEAMVATTDGEAIPEPAYTKGWEAAATLWNLTAKTARSGQMKALAIDPEAEGWCTTEWTHTVEVTR